MLHPDFLNKVLLRRQIVEWAAFYKVCGPFDGERSDEYVQYIVTHIRKALAREETTDADFRFSWEPEPEPVQVEEEYDPDEDDEYEPEFDEGID